MDRAVAIPTESIAGPYADAGRDGIGRRNSAGFRLAVRASVTAVIAAISLQNALAQQGFTDSMLYNNAKAGVVYDLYEKIFDDDPVHPHDPQPRLDQLPV